MNGPVQRGISPCLRSAVCGGEGQGRAAEVLPHGDGASRRGSCQGACCCGEGSPIGYIPEPYSLEKFPKAGHLEYRLLFEGQQIAEKATFEECQEAVALHQQREVMEGRT